MTTDLDFDSDVIIWGVASVANPLGDLVPWSEHV